MPHEDIMMAFKCSFCGGKNECGADMAGIQVLCPHCGKQIRIPTPHAGAVSTTPDVPKVVPTGDFIYLCESCGARHVCAPEAFGQEFSCEKCRRIQKIENLAPHKTINILHDSPFIAYLRFFSKASLGIAIVSAFAAVGFRYDIDIAPWITFIIICSMLSLLLWVMAYFSRALDRIIWSCDRISGLPEYRKK